MAEFNIRSDAIDVEQIMAQIRSRIGEKRGVDYTEEEVRELANVKLERFLDPKNVRSDLLDHYRRRGAPPAADADPTPFPMEFDPTPFPVEFDPASVYRSTRPGLVGRGLFRIRRLLNPILKLFFNPAPLLESVSVQSRDVRQTAMILQERTEKAARILHERTEKAAEILRERTEMDTLTYEVMNNLVVEMTRLALDMKNHKMRVESVAARLDFDERRARALEETVLEPPRPSGGKGNDTKEGTGERRRRRRRGGRRRSDTGVGSEAGAAVPGPADAGASTAPDDEPGATADTGPATAGSTGTRSTDADAPADVPVDPPQAEPKVDPETPADASLEGGPLDPDEES